MQIEVDDVDAVSVDALTDSARALDIGLDFHPPGR